MSTSDTSDLPLLACRHVAFGWAPEHSVVDLPLLSVRRGERVFVCGPSGSGKSTLLGLLTGVLKPQRGSVLAMGRLLSSMSAPARDRFRADHVGYIFQQLNLLPYLRVVENVLLGCAFSQRRRERASRDGTLIAEACRLLAAMDLDADAIADQPISQLSVGQQQRVAVARALIGAPELIIADEPTSALDAASRNTFVNLLLDECTKHGSGLVFVSHDLALAGHFDRTIEMRLRVSGKVKRC